MKTIIITKATHGVDGEEKRKINTQLNQLRKYCKRKAVSQIVN